MINLTINIMIVTMLLFPMAISLLAIKAVLETVLYHEGYNFKDILQIILLVMILIILFSLFTAMAIVRLKAIF